MKHLIANLLKKIANDLDAGTTTLDESGCRKVLHTINLMQNGDQEMTKSEASEYIGVCRATFDNYVRDGFIPRGNNNHRDTKTLFWWKSDLDQFLYKQEQNQIELPKNN